MIGLQSSVSPRETAPIALVFKQLVQLTNEEARLGDEKRRIARDALALKLGALLELGERQTVVSEMSRMLIAEIPQVRTDPGRPRPMYEGEGCSLVHVLTNALNHRFEGYSTTEEVMQEAQRCLTSLVFNPTTESQTTLPTPNALQDASESIQRFAQGQTSSQSHVPQHTSTTLGDPGAPQLPQIANLSSPNSPTQQQPPTDSKQMSIQLPSPSPYGGTFDEDQSSALAYLGSSISVGYPSPALPAGASSGPPQTYDAANGHPRHGIRTGQASEGTQYDYGEDRHWVRNQATSGTVAAPVVQQQPPSQGVNETQELDHQSPIVPPPKLPSPPEPSRTYASYTKPELPSKRSSQDDAPIPSRISADATDRPIPPRLPSHLTDFKQQSSPLSPAPPYPLSGTTSPSALPQPPSNPTRPGVGERKSSSPPTSPQAPSIPVAPTAHDFYNARVQANDILAGSLPSAPPRVAPVVAVPPRNSFDGPGPISPASGGSRSASGKARGDSKALGSKHGFDDSRYKGEADTSAAQTNQFPSVRPSTRDNTGPPSGYTYHPPGTYSAPSSGLSNSGRKGLTASQSQGPSPAMLIQQEYMRKERESLERERASREADNASRAMAEGPLEDRPVQDEEQQEINATPDSVAPLKVNKRRSEE